MITPTTPIEFRTAFPKFLDPICFPDGEISFWALLATKLHNANRWGDLLPFGMQLFIAHNLAIEYASKGNKSAPGLIQGAVSSASVDKVSYSRDVASVMNKDAGHWNLTTYGLRYRQLVQMVGAGPMQVGPHDTSEGFGGFWPGVIPPMQG